MKHKALFNEKILFDDSSPTKIRLRKNGKVAGKKVKSLNHWIVSIKNPVTKAPVNWSLARVLYEMYYGFEPPSDMYVLPLDGNKDNLEKNNLALFPSTWSYKKLMSLAYPVQTTERTH